MEQQFIRNFAIISHIDHGKSTLADCLLTATATIPPRSMRPQVLDNMELERERGVTIKLKAVRMNYTLGAIPYTLNLIDTPGHLDFAYEVSRSLAACEGAILIVDASQGIQAQTLAHFERAKRLNLKLIPVISKIDLEAAAPEKTAEIVCRTFGFNQSEIIFSSARNLTGIDEILAALVERIPPPSGNLKAPLRALVFDSKYDEHKGVLAYVRIVDGEYATGRLKQKIRFIGSHEVSSPVEIGYFAPEAIPVKRLSVGEVGYIATGLKDISKVRVGDTITAGPEESKTPLSGYRVPSPMVFASLYPAGATDFFALREALEKLSLTDASFTFHPEASGLGKGFSGGFLGAFHAEIIKERLEREYGLTILMTRPASAYEIIDRKNQSVIVQRAEDFPAGHLVKEIREPWILAHIFLPMNYLGLVMELCQNCRGRFRQRRHLGESVELIYELPFSEMLSDFFDRLKSLSSGFASLEWEFLEYRSAPVLRLDFLIHGERVPALSRIVLSGNALVVGQKMTRSLKEILPPQQFSVAIQAAIGGKIIARETVAALGKNVLAKLSGGHRERKDKVLERQKEGKKRLAKVGKVPVPEEAFWLN